MIEQHIEESIRAIRTRTDLIPELALILGTGLGELAEELQDAVFIPYGDIPHFCVSTAPSHKGRLAIGRLGGKVVMCMQGRVHFYEGYSMADITYPIKVFRKMGIGTILLTNSCGGLNPDFKPGDLMVITDHINYMGTNPLIGANDDSMGPRFPDMSKIYKKELRDLAHSAAKELGLSLREGIYVSYMGPSFETPAEIRLFQSFGGSAVGMSTVPEAIIANWCGMKVLAISCVTNLAAGILDQPLTGEEVIEVANEAGVRFRKLLKAIVSKL